MEGLKLAYKYGIILGKNFYPNSGTGHEKNAREIIIKKGWELEYDKYYKKTHRSHQDFLIMEKGAVQLGSSGQRFIIYSVFKVSEHDINKILIKYDLVGYKKIPYSR